MELLSIFSLWDIAVLGGAMAGTQKFKPFLKKRDMNDWWIMFLPFLFSGIGLAALLAAGEYDLEWLPVKVFVFGTLGNYIFRAWKGVQGAITK